MTNVRTEKRCPVCRRKVPVGSVCVTTDACARLHIDDQIVAARIFVDQIRPQGAVLSAQGLAAMF